MGDFRKLHVFDLAHQLTLHVYQATTTYPQAELFALTSQTRRAAASIGSNLAEGSGRESDRELVRSSRIALGSANELEYHLLLARDLGYLDDDIHAALSEESLRVQRMLAALIRRLSKGTDHRPKTEDQRP